MSVISDVEQHRLRYGSPLPPDLGSSVLSPDGSTAYVASTGIDTVTPITVASNTAGAAIASPGGPYGGAIVPDQAPTAVLAAVPPAGHDGSIAFDASASSDTSGTIASYAWNFGDGTSVVTTSARLPRTPTPIDGTYTASVTLTNTIGTSNTLVFTGQTVTRNGGRAAKATRPSPSPRRSASCPPRAR